MADKQIYLDHAAATPVDPAVMAAMKPYFSDKFYNPSAIYLAAKKVNQDLQNARKTVAGHLGARAEEIIFTAGGTEANNLAINGIMQAHPSANMLFSAVEHESVIKPAQLYKQKTIGVRPNGIVDIKDLMQKIDNNTVLISVVYANNEIGTIQPIAEIAKNLQFVRESRLKKGIKTPIYLHTDACQAPAYLDLHVSRLGADLMTINGGKIYGPKQSGALYVKTGVKIKPQILGGGQERGYRSGTQNVAFIIGLCKALDVVQKRRASEVKRLQDLQRLFISELKKQIPKASINGSLKNRLPNNVHVTIAGTDNETVMMKLDEQGIICAVGSACSASSEEPSHVLMAVGLNRRQAQSSLRFSMGHDTSQADVKRTADVLKNCL